jgi:hypothetical protein
MAEPGPTNEGRDTAAASMWDRWIDYIADVPWGVLGFVLLAYLLFTNGLEADDVAAIGTATGLLAVGHAIHRGSKRVRPRTMDAERPMTTRTSLFPRLTGRSKAAESATPDKKATVETLRWEYEEICRSHQAITDFRGKLLGLLPLASGAAILLLIDEQTATHATALLVAAGLFGAAVTLGLYFYERRGMVECLLLRERGGNLERALWLSDDFARFLNNTPGFVGPQGAGPIVYFAVMAAWLFVALHGLSRSQPRLELALGLVIIAGYLTAVRLAAIEFRHRSESRRAATTGTGT